MFSISSVWDRATEFVGDNISTLFPFALVVIATATVQGVANDATAGVAPTTALAVSGVMLVVSLFSVIARLAIIALAIDDDRGASGALALAIGRLLSVVAVLVAVIVAAVLLTLPVIAALFAGGVDPSQLRAMTADTMAAVPFGVRLFMLFYMLAVAVVLVWVAARLALVLPVMLAERLTFGAFARSFALTKGRALRILGVLLLIAIVGGVAAMAARTVFGSILRLALVGDTALSAASVITAFIVASVATIFTVIGDAFTGKLYVAARAAEADTQDA